MFDSFAGPTKPTEEDVVAADNAWTRFLFLARKAKENNEWCYGSLDEVSCNFCARGLLTDRVHLTLGPVEETLLAYEGLPDRVYFLRLGTDFYASTLVEMQVPDPPLEAGGAFAVDGFGHWAGSRPAVDRRSSTWCAPALMLNCVDYTCRIGRRLA
jgi:hypothetical protein